MCSAAISAPRKNAPSGFNFNGVPGRPVAWEMEDWPASMTRPFSTSSPVTKVRVDRVSFRNRASSARERLPLSFSNLKTRAWLICRIRLGVAMGKRTHPEREFKNGKFAAFVNFVNKRFRGPNVRHGLEILRQDADRSRKRLQSGRRKILLKPA